MGLGIQGCVQWATAQFPLGQAVQILLIMGRVNPLGHGPCIRFPVRHRTVPHQYASFTAIPT